MHFWKLNEHWALTENQIILVRKIKKSEDFLQIFGMWIMEEISNFWKICEIPTRFGEVNEVVSSRIGTNIEQFWRCCLKNCEKISKIRDENLLKYWGLSGAEACSSCRSRQELSNEYLIAKIGFYTAKNEPFNFHNFSSLQGFNFHRAVVSVRHDATLRSLGASFSVVSAPISIY